MMLATRQRAEHEDAAGGAEKAGTYEPIFLAFPVGQLIATAVLQSLLLVVSLSTVLGLETVRSMERRLGDGGDHLRIERLV